MEMREQKNRRLSRADWVLGALDVLRERGVDGVKIVVIAERMGVTSGSFYWHFKGLQDLFDCLLDYWERELTDAIRDQARAFTGPPEDRILNLMVQVIEEDAAVYDHAISIWARSNPAARKVFERTLKNRFDFAAWMYKKVGFSEKQARIRGRLLVAYLMGESATNLKSDPNWQAEIREKHKLLISRASRPTKKTG
jgi:AcrR family transcriptional regulator